MMSAGTQTSIITDGILKQSAKNAIKISKTILKDKRQKIMHWSRATQQLTVKFLVKKQAFRLACYSPPQPKDVLCFPPNKQVGGAFLCNFKNAQKWQHNFKIGWQCCDF